MLSKYEAVCYELLRPEQITSLREAAAIAYVPAGSLEWHGLQNPPGTDWLKARAICCEAAIKHVLPTPPPSQSWFSRLCRSVRPWTIGARPAKKTKV